jgi:BASS family bile acid:Na+ symporter
MNEFLAHALHPVILIYVVSAMLALGMGQTVAQILGPLRNIRLTVSAVVASYIILPLLAATTARLFGLDQGLRFGLVLMAMAAGAEIGPLLSGISKANVRLAGGLLVLSIGITIVYLPLMLGVFLPDAHVPVGHLVVKLLLTIVAPLVIGLLVRARWESVAHTAEKYLHLVSRVFVLLLTLIVLLLYYQRIIGLLGTYANLAAVITILGGFGIGYLLGGPEPGNRLAMAYMHGARSASIAVMVATDVFADQPSVMLMIAVMTLFILVINIPLSYLLRLTPDPAIPPAVHAS